MVQFSNKRVRYVRITAEEFDRAIRELPGQGRMVSLPGVWECVYDLPVYGVRGLVVRIYSSIDKLTRYSRDKGADAIRLVLLRSDNEMVLSDSIKILRTGGWQLRLLDRVKGLIHRANTMVCPECRILLTRRTGRHGEFLGCPNYPECSYTRSTEKR